MLSRRQSRARQHRGTKQIVPGTTRALDKAPREIWLYSCVTMRLILFSKNLNKNTGLFHLARIELAPSAQPETISKLPNVLFLADNFFFREWRLNKRQER